ncbi:MAG: hypothetical protein IPN86_04815 [Saprospiraceae bacterium]|nr:hypothetical protein [Saprospiraceae bacterium]
MISKAAKEILPQPTTENHSGRIGGNPQRGNLNRLQLLSDKKKWPKDAKDAFDREIIKARRIQSTDSRILQ